MKFCYNDLKILFLKSMYSYSKKKVKKSKSES
jgi:hypothetical protein